LAVFNEAPFIEATVRSLLDQQGEGFEIEILAVDGRSTDGTSEILKRLSDQDSRLRHLLNPRRVTPAAFNIGLAEARGEFVGVFGAHATYDQNYVATCLRELKDHAAVGCSGRLITRPASHSLQARLVAWALAHPFGSSSRSVRTQPEGYADTVPFAIFVKSALLEVGGYDEQLVRNQDNNMAEQLRARGGRLYLTWQTAATYFTKAKLADLARYAFNSGYWNVISFRLNPRSMRLRHFVPLAFVLALAAGLALTLASPWLADRGLPFGAAPLAGLLALYGVVASIAGLHMATAQRALAPLLLPPTFFLFHAAYGTGSLFAMLAGKAPADRRTGRRVPA
jgi:glycosyltransferase involved in cell wall biosynthesis